MNAIVAALHNLHQPLLKERDFIDSLENVGVRICDPIQPSGLSGVIETITSWFEGDGRAYV